jgi:tetratricopeptide (TPR) repeat protein
MATRRGLVRALPWLLLVAFAVSLSLQTIRTFDYWWHLRTGQLIAETGAVPKVDPFSYTVPGARWVDIHWLHQLGLHGLYSLGGHAAVVWGKAALVLALLGILGTIGYRRERPFVTAFALALMLMVACDRIMPRPELPTFVCLAAVLALLDRHARRGDAWVYAIVGVQLVWVNLHGLFAVGIAVCAIYWVAEILYPFLAPGQAWRADHVRRLTVVMALAALASLANPNFLDGALYPLQQLDMVGPADERGWFGSVVAELVPPLGSEFPLDSAILSFAAGLAALSFGAMALNWRRLHGSDPLLWVAFLYLGLGAKRNVALFAIVTAPILVRNLNEFLDARPISPRLRSAGALLVALSLAGLTTDVVRERFFLRVGQYRQPGFQAMELLYPVAQAEWIAEHQPPGPIAHHMADGGYLIWRLWPEYQVMTDGRLEVFGAEKFAEVSLAGVPERFRKLDKEYHFGSVIVHYSLLGWRDFLWWLYLNSNWALVSVDDAAALFVRVPDHGTLQQPEVDIDDPNLFPSLDGMGRVDLIVRTKARASFYYAMHRYKRALETWEGGAERLPEFPKDPVVHAGLLYTAGFGAAAEAILRTLLEERPDDARLRTQVGDLRLESGDREAAREFYESALAIDPNFSYALHQRAALAEIEGDPDQAAGLYLRVIAGTRPSSPLAIRAAERLRTMGVAVDFGVRE